jgi:hypothetical protein
VCFLYMCFHIVSTGRFLVLFINSFVRKISRAEKIKNTYTRVWFIFSIERKQALCVWMWEIFDDGRHAPREVKRSNLMTFSNRIISRCAAKVIGPYLFWGEKRKRLICLRQTEKMGPSLLRGTI